jgi:thiol-disulfide isomerase/thioredoxin
MDDKKTKIARIVVFTVIVLSLVVIMKLIVGATKVSAKYDQFAECLVNKGAKFYGAFWCPHCQAQEATFGMSRDKMANLGLYKECSNPDQSENDFCKALGIEGYPTWIFADGSRVAHELKVEELATKTTCALPTASITPVK